MSETDFLKLKKHDNPETNTEKFDIENYLNGNWDKIDKNVGKVNTDILNINSKNKEQDTNIKQLQGNTETSSNKIAKLEKELKETQEDFYQNSIRGQASGEYIHVEDSSNCRSIIGISGHSEQETRSGKNKIEITKTTTTVNGCTHTIKDGTDTLSGTSSTNWANLIIYSFVGDGKTYTLSGSPSTSKNIFISAHDNVQKKDLATSKNCSTGTFVATSGNSIDIIICVAPNLTLANELFKPQLEEGLKATVWEQGGASPSPGYPSEVKSVGSNVNIFDKDNMTIGKIWSGAILLDSDVGNASPKIPVTAGKTYIRNAGYSSNYIIKENNSIVDVQGGTNAITMSEDAKYWIFNIPKDIDINTIKAEEGSISTPYSKFGQGCVKVTKCNKNLAIKNVKGYFSMSGFKIKIDNNSESFLFYAEKGKEYTRSCKVYLDRNRIGKIDTLDVTQGMTVLNGQEINSKKFICDDSGIYIWFVNSTLNDSIKESFQIEESSTESSFEQHEEQSYIMPVQQEILKDDYLDYDNEEEVHVWGKKILTGDEGWRMPSSNDTNAVFTNLSNTDFCDFKSDTDVQYCNYFKYKGIAQGFAVALNKGVGIYSFYSVNKYEYIVAPKAIASSVNEWKAYLKSQYDAGTPVMIYYKLQTPTRLKFTDEQKAVAKELNNARTYKNVTNITTDSKAILSLDYAKDLETLLNNTQALAVNNASEGV